MGLRILPSGHMACAIRPRGSRCYGGFFEAGALIEKHSHRVLQYTSVNAIIDLEFDGANPLVNVNYRVRPRGRQIGEIKPPDFVARYTIRGTAIPGESERPTLTILPVDLSTTA